MSETNSSRSLAAGGRSRHTAAAVRTVGSPSARRRVDHQLMPRAASRTPALECQFLGDVEHEPPPRLLHRLDRLPQALRVRARHRPQLGPAVGCCTSSGASPGQSRQVGVPQRHELEGEVSAPVSARRRARRMRSLHSVSTRLRSLRGIQLELLAARASSSVSIASPRSRRPRGSLPGAVGPRSGRVGPPERTSRPPPAEPRPRVGQRAGAIGITQGDPSQAPAHSPDTPRRLSAPPSGRPKERRSARTGSGSGSWAAPRSAGR